MRVLNRKSGLKAKYRYAGNILACQGSQGSQVPHPTQYHNTKSLHSPQVLILLPKT